MHSGFAETGSFPSANLAGPYEKFGKLNGWMAE
jgi:hypothetical protein